MSTERLIEQLFAADGSDGSAQRAHDALRVLLDDSTVEASGMPMGIAEAAAVVGLSTSTLRYYEREGLVHPARDPAGRRAYSDADLRRLVFCTRMRVSGMGVGLLKEYIALVNEGASTVNARRDIMREHRAQILARRRELDLALAATEYKIATYGGAPGI